MTQGLFSLLALSNVLNVRYKIKRLSRPIAQQIAPHMRPNGVAILVQILLLNFEKLDAVIQQVLYAGGAGLQFIRMRNVLEAQLQQLSLGVTEHLAKKAVDLKKSTGGRDQRHSMRRKTKCGTETRFVDSRRLFGALKFALLQPGRLFSLRGNGWGAGCWLV